MNKDVKNLEIYQLALDLSNRIWEFVVKWEHFEKNTVGTQLVRAADSIGANIAEGFGRYHFKENKLFCYFARGSLEESKHWLRIAYQRKIISKEQLDSIKPLLEKLPPKLNNYIKKIGEPANRVTSDE